MTTRHRWLWAACLLLLAQAPLIGQEPGNLLRNGDFQDDWLTLLPELKNHHWNYTTEVFNRRDYNPDGWRLSGKWDWRDADKPAGQRRFVMNFPSKAVQAVNWVTVNNPKVLEGWPDAGGYPKAEFPRSKNPLALVRDLTFRVRLSGKNVPDKAASITVAFAPGSPIDDPTGTKRIVSASEPVPAGTYANRTVTVTLPAKKWLDEANKDAQAKTLGPVLPGSVVCEINCGQGKDGEIEVHEAVLTEPGPASPNVLYGGDFHGLNKSAWVDGWDIEAPRKYSYFPPGIYYIFNTWHNTNSANRGYIRPDPLVSARGWHSWKMILAAGDETQGVSERVTLDQKEARLIEVSAWVKTDQACMIQIDALDQEGRRLDCFNFIHKNPLSVGTNDWRQVRQVFRPSAPLKSIRLKLCARGMNGYTLDDTGLIPQQNAVGTVWWDNVHLFEPESNAEDLKARGVRPPKGEVADRHLHLRKLDPGERLIGRNILSAEIFNPGPDQTVSLEWSFTSPTGKESTHKSAPVRVPRNQAVPVRISYNLSEPCPAYREYRGGIRLLDEQEVPIREYSSHWFATWPAPMDLELGALYLRPDQKQFVRINLGLSYAEMADLKSVRLDVLRRGTGQVLKTFSVPATLDDVAARRAKLPDGLREDLRNLVLADLDLSFLPLQPFDDPQRNWLLRATTVDKNGKDGFTTTSQPFCRLAHDGPQQPIRTVRIDKDGTFLVNDKPWMPWGVTYGHNPVYDGPADAAKSLDLKNLQQWSLYDRHGGNLRDRKLWDLNCLRLVEGGAPVKKEQLEEHWKNGLYASTVFVKPPEPGKPWPDDFLKYLQTAPMVPSVSRGPEEAFGYFSGMKPDEIAKVKAEVEHLRKTTGKPVMVGHGGYWTRLEFEKIPFFDIYDPETEPLYPAPLHTDLKPLVEGQAKAVWLRPQMYEDVPFERWRYHVFVELMRGARGWQIAHGPGDPSTFRGLHAELRRMMPAIYSKEAPPKVEIEPPLENMVRQVGKKTVIVAGTTHGMSFGGWDWGHDEVNIGRTRVTADPSTFSDESDGYHVLGSPPGGGQAAHGIQNLIDSRRWPAGSKLIVRVKLDPDNPPKNLVALLKADGRWTHAVGWGKWDLAKLRADNARSFWFLRTFYRHARGFLGWGDKVPAHALDYLPSEMRELGALPQAGRWLRLEIPLDKIGVAGKLLDGVGFVHEGGRAWWARTAILDPDGNERIIFGDQEDRYSPQQLEKVRFSVPGLKKGAKVRVLFEDREIVAGDGFFEDDFRGVDLYQRFGGERSGYGNSPVALHVYEVTFP